jgi:hypothetical protein
MRAAIIAATRNSTSSEPAELTLLELVGAVSESTDSDRETVAVVLDLLRTKRVRLRGNFRGAPFSDFC